MQVMEGDLARTIEQNLGKIAHMQLADNPGRHEPGSGAINYPFLFDAIDRMGYKGWIGSDSNPKAGTTGGLGWLPPYPAASAAADYATEAHTNGTESTAKHQIHRPQHLGGAHCR